MAELRLQNVSKRFADHAAVDDVSFDIRSGEFVTLLGPSGCGKSTTLKIIAGLIAPDGGRVLIGGQDVTEQPVRLRNIGMVFQSLALFPHLSVAQNVGFGLRMHGMAAAEIRRRVDSILEVVHLSGFEERLPAELSGGQQQRVALARALVTEPTVMLLDEPLGALDRKLREELQVEIRRITRTMAITSIFVTHDQQEALAMSDRIAVMNRGRIEHLDRPEILFRQPLTPFVADFMGVSNLFDAVATGGQGIELRLGEARIALQAPASYATETALRVGLRPEDASVRLADQAAQPHEIPCTVDAAVYQGADLTLQVIPVAAPGTRLTVRVPALAGTGMVDRFPAGASVWLAWRPEALLVFAA